MNNCMCKFFHKTTDISEDGIISVDCSDDICDKEPFNIVICQCLPPIPNPVAVQIIVNGSAVPLLDCIGNQVYSNDLKPRRGYYGIYGATPSHIILKNDKYFWR